MVVPRVSNMFLSAGLQNQITLPISFANLSQQVK